MTVAEPGIPHPVVRGRGFSERDCNSRCYSSFAIVSFSLINISNLIYGVAAADVEEFDRKVQGSAVYQF